jgi:peptidyl-prolyl cis-trans isomerase SurA
LWAVIQLHSTAHAQSARSADYIVVVVNSEPITNSEVQSEVVRARKQLQQRNQAVPAAEELKKNVLERLISEKAQLQLAADNGIRVDEAAVDQAEMSIANQNQVEVAELRSRMERDGVDAKTFRAQLRDQITLTRLREREVDSRVRITDQDIDRFIQERQATNKDPLSQDINLAQLLIAVPEKASAEDAAAIYLRAQKLLERIQGGESFERLVQEYSAAERANGGQLGLRRADRYPLLFVNATKDLGEGGISQIVRSPAGLHILKVVEKRAPAVLVQTVEQTRARHILLRTGPQLTQAAGLARLAEIRKRIVSGKTDFQTVAQDVSQDGSAAQGGDLGWVSPGTFVPEFEEVLNVLQHEGEISNPVASRFGVHLIQLVERRRVDMSPRELREFARLQLRESRIEEAYALWERDVRGRAFVDMREPPQ